MADRELRIERDAEQAAIPEVVDLGAQVGRDRRRRRAQAREDFDQAALLGDEDAAVRREGDIGRLGQAAEDDVFR
jgi:hypothetical protein